MDTDKLLKDPLLPPPVGPGGYEVISFSHPNYGPRGRHLFSLPRVDKTRNPDRPLGVHHGTALLACRIVAGNAAGGRLCLDRAGEEPVGVGTDEILDGWRYYFVLDDYRTHTPLAPLPLTTLLTPNSPRWSRLPHRPKLRGLGLPA